MYRIRTPKKAPAATASRLIANLMTALIPVEKYLKRGRPLTGVQVESLSLALRTFETFLAVWKTGKRYKDRPAKNEVGGSWFLTVMDKNRNQMDKNTNHMNGNWAAVMLGRRGGLKGGNARAKKLSAERRAAIARLAVRARWARRNSSGI